MEKTTSTTEISWPPDAPEREEDDPTQPLRIISSRAPHSGVPSRPRGSWFEKHDPPGARRTPDFTEIGDPAA